MDVATNSFTLLDDFIINFRDKFDYFESSVKEKNTESDYKDLSQRTRAIEFVQGHKHRFGFSPLKTLNSEEFKHSCKEFVKIYYEDVSEKELEMECLHLTEYLKIVQSSENEETTSFSGIYHLLKENKIKDTFSNVEIALRIFLSMVVTNCRGERFFSKSKRIKNKLKTMLQERLTSLSPMFIECDVLKDIDFEEVIDDFACLKSRRVPL
ncbi:hypothetical protein ILUMI_11539 [Ignelater luminosus]|uniref:HAT C-terminal dimerisation domain-containing protein n=1 Tax=Ignelater luminosus TaxID=2038154 RepID=A0A8K0D042_IGNLU|nr:hypothetical protein ILUMI_11539 [Ignelater luminosus]